MKSSHYFHVVCYLVEVMKDEIRAALPSLEDPEEEEVFLKDPVKVSYPENASICSIERGSPQTYCKVEDSQETHYVVLETLDTDTVLNLHKAIQNLKGEKL